MWRYTMENIRVNKITVNVDKKYGGVKISLYKTNTLLGTLTEDDLDLPLFTESGVSLKAYQMYCKDFVIELLNKDGIPGFYYEQKSENKSIKYSNSTFKSGVTDYIKSMLGDRYEYKVLMTERLDITERYKDGCIKNATGEFDVRLTQYDIKIVVVSEIKSGQLCRPRVIKYNGTEYSFNITNVGRIIKQCQ